MVTGYCSYYGVVVHILGRRITPELLQKEFINSSGLSAVSALWDAHILLFNGSCERSKALPPPKPWWPVWLLGEGEEVYRPSFINYAVSTRANNDNFSSLSLSAENFDN